LQGPGRVRCGDLSQTQRVKIGHVTWRKYLHACARETYMYVRKPDLHAHAAHKPTRISIHASRTRAHTKIHEIFANRADSFVPRLARYTFEQCPSSAYTSQLSLSLSHRLTRFLTRSGHTSHSMRTRNSHKRMCPHTSRRNRQFRSWKCISLTRTMRMWRN
jgi:hypothetical protein